MDILSDNNSIFNINNAGLVIIAPFLSRFFNDLGLTDKERFRSLSHALRASSILNYLTGPAPQNNFTNRPFPLFLCGLDPRIAYTIEENSFTQFENECCNDLLDSIIYQWKELKNTSRDGFRSSFLQRNGVLTLTDPPKLFIERTRINILLETLPWAISMQKLPWLETIFTVEW